MKTQPRLLLILSLCVTFGVAAKDLNSEKPGDIDSDVATIKAQYEWKTTSRVRNLESKEEKSSQNSYKYILQIAPKSSHFYDPQAFYIDSLRNDPEGKAFYRAAQEKILHEAIMAKAPWSEYMQKTKEAGLDLGHAYRCRKDFNKGSIRVWDMYFADRHRYDVEMSDLEWEMQDSTKNILGYECFLAATDYHGRKWQAWFAPEIPVSDGPWQFCGLPGLIMEAESEGGDYGFYITGIQECSEQLKNPYETDRFFISKRKSFLKSAAYTRDNRSSVVSAMTNGGVKARPKTTESLVDFIETDYHE